MVVVLEKRLQWGLWQVCFPGSLSLLLSSIQKYMGLKYEPSSEPPHISAKLLFFLGSVPSEYGTNKTVQALAIMLNPLKCFKMFPLRSEVGCGGEAFGSAGTAAAVGATIFTVR